MSLPSHSLRHTGMDRGSPPRAQHHKCVVNSNTQEQKRCRHIQTDELDANVASKSKGCHDGHACREQPTEANDGLRSDIVGHDSSAKTEDDHGHHVDNEDIGDGESGFFHLPSWRVRHKPANLENKRGKNPLDNFDRYVMA